MIWHAIIHFFPRPMPLIIYTILFYYCFDVYFYTHILREKNMNDCALHNSITDCLTVENLTCLVKRVDETKTCRQFIYKNISWFSG